jgi:gliding motility-associated-like protein
MNQLLPKNLLLLLCVLAVSNIFGQLVVTNNETPEDLVQNYLVGSGVVVTNVEFNGMPGTVIDPQIGFFDALNTNLGIDSGLILSSGMVTDAIGPNNASGMGTDFFTSLGDPDLNAISFVSINDEAILEFDIIPAGDTLEFSYSFASEEYMEYVGGGINDAFGIFLSGTGITGPYSNNAVNIALIPGTATPVTIDNVNAFTNAAYYVDNGDGFTAPYNTSNTYIQYDGRTVTLVAKYPVQCGGSYHLKFAIGDGVDGILDSGVFIEAGSLSSSGVQIDIQSPVGFFSNTPGVVYEDCAIGSDVDFIFVRPDSTYPDTVYFDLGGDAINGVDYTNIPNNYIVFNNSDTTILTISAFGDGIVEGIDTMWIAVPIANSGPCANIYDTTFLYISDPYQVIPNAGPDSIYYCVGQIVDFLGGVDVGVPPYNYTWSDGSTNNNVSYTITQLNFDTLILDVVDACGFIGSDTVYFTQQAPPAILIDAGPDTALNCAGEMVTLNGMASGGVAPLDFYWADGTQSTTVQPLVTTEYILTAIDDCDNVVTDTVEVYVPPFSPFTIVSSDTSNQFNCVGDQDSLFAYATGGGTAPYSYLWSTGSTDTTLNVTLISPNVNYQFTVTDACGLDSTINFNFFSNQGTLDLQLSAPRQCRNADSTASIFFEILGGNPPYTMTDVSLPFGVTGYIVDDTANVILVDMAQTGMYTFEVAGGCNEVAQESVNLTMMTCEVSTPNVMTPNGDGINDELIFSGLQYHPNSELMVYNRWGNLVYSDMNYQNNWNGGGLPDGLYYYVLRLTDGTIPGEFHGHINIFN